MNRPTVFISSTIYDFKDLRSAMKYWLEEAGYVVQLSEHSDFAKDSAQNSYDACLDVISNCDYFILLIGNRVGGMFDNEISITRKEYETAYELAKGGRIKKIITFVRQNIWDILQDRQSLKPLLSELDILENGNLYDKDKIVYHESKLIHDAKHIQAFINEVTRKDEFKNDEKPCFNWINVFNNFSDIITVLKIEMRLENNIARQITEQSLKMALVHNLQELAWKYENGKISANFFGFTNIRPKIVEFRKESIMPESLLNGTIQLTTNDIHDMSQLLLFVSHGVEELESHTFEQLISSGAFLDYNKDKACYESNNITLALSEMIREINRLKKFTAEFPKDAHTRMLDLSRNYHYRKKMKHVSSE